jgi:flagellar biosynthesis protein FlhG
MACILPNFIEMKYHKVMDWNKTKHFIIRKDFFKSLIPYVSVVFIVLFYNVNHAHHDVSIKNISYFPDDCISYYAISKNLIDTYKDKLQRSDELIMKDRIKLINPSFRDAETISLNLKNNLMQKILVLSGKKEVGKSFLSRNLAEALSDYDNKVLLVNCDFGNSTKFSPELSQEVSIEEIVSSSAEQEITQLAKNLNYLPNFQNRPKQILNKNSNHNIKYDYVFFDTHTGLSSFNLSLLQNSDLGLLVSTTDPSSIHDIYILVKALQPYLNNVNLCLIINQITEDKKYEKLYEDLRIALNQFLGYELGLIGIIPFDQEVTQKTLNTEGLAIKHFSPAIIHIRKIANLLTMVNLSRSKKQAQGCKVS